MSNTTYLNNIDENFSPTKSAQKRSSFREGKERKSLGEINEAELEKHKNTTLPSSSASKPRSIKKMLSTPVKAIRNLLPSVPSGWYGDGSQKSAQKSIIKKKTESIENPAVANMNDIVSVQERIKALKAKETANAERRQSGDNLKSELRHNSSNDNVASKSVCRSQSPLLCTLTSSLEQTSNSAFTSSTSLVLDEMATDMSLSKAEDKSKKEKVNRRVSMDLSMAGLYDEEKHLPKYSEAEVQDMLTKVRSESRTNSSKDTATSISKLEVEKNMLESELAALKKSSKAAAYKHEELKRELISLKVSYESMDEDAGLQKVQSKALTHRLQALEKEMADLQKQKDTDSAEAILSQERAVESAKKTMEDMLITTKHQSDAALKACADEAERRIGALRGQLEEAARDAKIRDSKHAIEVSTAVKDAKARVYEKAKQQFEAGNKEFTKVKAQLKDCIAEKETIKSEVEKLKTSNESMKEEINTVTIKIAATEGYLASLLEIMGVTDLSDMATAIATAHTNYTQLVSKNEQLECELLSLRESNPKLETKLTATEKILTSLEAKMALSQETLKATEALLEEAKHDADIACQDRDAQMMAVAKLTTVNAGLEQKVEAAEKESGELTARCNNLRKMNEEMLTMLEANANTAK
jgi:chromosome segregation ATPase